MKKCDVKGCKRKAEYFTPSFAYCFIHWKELEKEARQTVIGYKKRLKETKK
jgi:hypothetical protein